MQVDGKLAVRRQALERITLQNRLIAVDVIEHFRLEHEEPAVDPALAGLRLLAEFGHHAFVEDHAAEPGGRTHRRDGGQPAVFLVVLHDGAHIDVRHAIAVGQQETFVANPFGQPFDSPPGFSGRAGVDQVHDPVFPVAVVRRDASVAQVDAEVAAQLVILDEVALDRVTAVPERQHELLEAARGVVVHDMPQDRPAADLHHGLRPQLGFFAEPRPETAAENHNLHRSIPIVSPTTYMGRAFTSSYIRPTYSPTIPSVTSCTPPRNSTTMIVVANPGIVVFDMRRPHK